jgi:hypothetical protein
MLLLLWLPPPIYIRVSIKDLFLSLWALHEVSARSTQHGRSELHEMAQRVGNEQSLILVTCCSGSTCGFWYGQTPAILQGNQHRKPVSAVIFTNSLAAERMCTVPHQSGLLHGPSSRKAFNLATSSEVLASHQRTSSQLGGCCRITKSPGYYLCYYVQSQAAMPPR